MEVLVTTAIMSVATLVIVGATIQIYSGTKQIEQTSVARDQMDTSFRRLDRELRYATFVNPPKMVGTRWYIEFALPATAPGVVPCRQLKIENGTLSMADWVRTSSTTPTVGPANTIATGVVLYNNIDPFQVYAPGDTPYASASAGTTGVGGGFSNMYQMVRFRFQVKDGTVTMPFDSVFTSQNIGAEEVKTAPDGASDCKLGRPTK